MRNPFHDFHFDLLEPELIVGKTLALLGPILKADNEILSRSVELLGWGLFNKWEKVDVLLQQYAKSKPAVAQETV